jgi:fructokinase
VRGGIEAGGTKWVCAIGTGPDELREVVTIPTTMPDETIARAVAFFLENGNIESLGVGSFGPVDLQRGWITTTPKAGWTNTDIVGALGGALGVPVAFDTDVNAAALGEQRWGAAIGLDTFCYLTVGTGIGGGVMAGNELVHGLAHSEIGHMRIPHDTARDPFTGSCPFHGDCFEGLASGTAIRERWGRSGDELAGEPDVWELQADYLALGVVNMICTVSPQLVILGGGVMEQPELLDAVRERVPPLLAGYVPTPEIAPPALGDRAGVLGAIELARRGATLAA